MHITPKTSVARRSFSPLLPPTAEGERNRRPMVLLHGSLVDQHGVDEYRDYARSRGYHLDQRTYPGIRDGAPIEESSQEASRTINAARLQIGRENLQSLQDGTSLDDFFRLKDATGPLRQHLQDCVAEVARLLEHSDEDLHETLSGKLAALQAKLETRLQGDGLANAGKVAAEVLDSLVPKAVVVGHSAGGVVAYNLAVSPEIDGSSGIGSVMLLAAPVKSGMPEPLPPGLAELPFYNWDTKVLQPWEHTPMWQLAQLNPMVRLGYPMAKALSKTASSTAMMVTTTMTMPYTWLTRPGFAQVMESSSFIRELAGKPIPKDVTVLSLTTPSDKMSLTERCQLDESLPNAHNFAVDICAEPGQLERERPTWSHVRMAQLPEQFEQQLTQSLIEHPQELRRVLDPRNDDGARCQALTWLGQAAEHDPEILQRRSIRQALKAVAGEQMPFSDSPASLAQKLLDPLS